MITVACATDDKTTFSSNHFGEAKFYSIYTIDNDNINHVEIMNNKSIICIEENEKHGDVRKAAHVIMLLEEKKVQVLANKDFGPNINRIKTRFVPVIIKMDNIKNGLELIREHYEEVLAEYRKDADRKPVRL